MVKLAQMVNVCVCLSPLQVLVGMMHKIYFMDRHVETFFAHFNRYYADALATDFGDLSLQQQVAYIRMLYKVRTLSSMYI